LKDYYGYNDFIKDVRSAANYYSLKIEILAKTKSVVKIKIPITKNVYIQLYYNQKSGTKNYGRVE